MIETITIDTEQWAVINRSEFIRAMDRFIRKESAEELLELIIAAAPRPEAVQQADQWTPGVSNYDRSIHSNPDAKAWADLFVQTFPGLADKHDLMLGWFANAMMAMHDHMARQPAPRPVLTVTLGKGDKLVADIFQEDEDGILRMAGVGIFDPEPGKVYGIGAKNEAIDGKAITEGNPLILIWSDKPESLQVIVEELQESIARMTRPAEVKL